MKLYVTLLALVAFGLYTNVNTSVANAPVAVQPQVELAVVKAPGLHWYDNTVEQN